MVEINELKQKLDEIQEKLNKSDEYFKKQEVANQKELRVSSSQLHSKEGKTYYNNELFTGDSYGENDKGMFTCKYINGDLVSKKCFDNSFNKIDCKD